MSALKRTKPLVECCYNSLASRSHHAAIRSASTARRSPQVMRKEKTPSGQTPGTIRMQKPIDPENALPPVRLLEMGSISGALDISPDQALSLLRSYQALERRPFQGWERKLCTDHNITPSTLVILAKILDRCPDPAQRRLAQKLMFSASALDEASATLQLVESALHHKKLGNSEIALPVQRLALLARRGNPSAMALLGKILLAQGKPAEALEWCRKASSLGQTEDFDGADEALCAEGEILFKRNDVSGAEAAWRRAAFEFDNPWAYYHLSQLHPKEEQERKKWLLKAAASGVAPAAYGLGIVEMDVVKAKLRRSPGWEKMNEVPKEILRSEELWMAKEWFEIAAKGGVDQSILHLVLVNKALGLHEEGLKWLEMAEGIPEIKKEARQTRLTWEKPNIELI